MRTAIHLDLDSAWAEHGLDLPLVDAREWGPRLRFCAPRGTVEEFYQAQADRLAPFILYGSGDFHHLSALWLRRHAEPLTVISFDNHPDWDVRPPKWCCGGWVNRALELPSVRKVSVWGCGNFEYWWPGRLFGNQRAERDGTLEIHAWADGRPAKDRNRRGAIFRANWREQFEALIAGLHGGDVYVTIDLDGLQRADAITNWENGRFSTEDIGWALERLRAAGRIVGGDICGAHSEPHYARVGQRFVAQFDHPKLPRVAPQEAQAINSATVQKLWPLLCE